MEARTERLLDVGRGQRELEPGRVAGDHPVHEVDLLEDGGDGGVARQRGRDEDRPELAADAALDQARDVGVGIRQPPQQVRRREVGAVMLADLPGQVVMPVDQREPAEHGAGQGEGQGSSVGSHHRISISARTVGAVRPLAQD
jgi:hypothetical protein